MRKMIALALIGLVVYGISQNPADWADTATALGDQIGDGMHNVGVFLHDLAT